MTARAIIALAFCATHASPLVARPAPQDVAATMVRVRSGDTLSAIAERTGAGAGAIAHANRLIPPYRLRPGRALAIPPGRYHRVRAGETGIGIAAREHVGWGRVIGLNDLAEPYALRAGDRLLLPSPQAAGAPTLDERAAAFHIDIDDLVTGTRPALRRQAPPPAPEPPRLPAASDRLLWPVAGRIVRGFGRLPDGTLSEGIDIAASPGSPVHAAAAGVVAYAGPLAGFGRLVLVRHAAHRLTAYGHLSAVRVARGDVVQAGRTLATLDGPALHFEVRLGRQPIDPARLLARPSQY